MKKVLVIGEHSYIGKSFKEYIEKKYQRSEVVQASEEDTAIENMGGCIQEGYVQVDMAGARNRQWQEVDFSQYDTILHVAAIVHQKETKEKQQLYIDVNQKLPVEVAKKAKEAGVKQFIFLSSMAVYGEVEGAITKETPLKPTTMYGRTKLAAERKIAKLADERFRIVILRPPMVYGENCPGNYTRLNKLARVLPVFPDVDNKRSMVHVDRLCQCIKNEMERNTSGEHVIIVHPQDKKPVKTTDLYVKLRSNIGKKTYTTKVFNGVIKVLVTKIGMVRKLFGSCYYEGLN